VRKIALVGVVADACTESVVEPARKFNSPIGPVTRIFPIIRTATPLLSATNAVPMLLEA